jgi:DNA polymerase elongation subunit (family B)
MKYTNIDLENATPEQIRAEIDRMKSMSNEWKNEEQAVKLTINSIYGALGNKWLTCFNPNVAETITAQGQDLIKYAEIQVNRYFKEFWHLDTELHEKIGVTGEVKPVLRPVNIYSDTDSVAADSLITTPLGVVRIEDLFLANSTPYTIDFDDRGNEIIHDPEIKVLNWKDHPNRMRKSMLKYSKVSKIIRHKVTKDKWELVSKVTGRRVFVTGDHSLIIFRDHKKLVLKAPDVKPFDMVLCVNRNPKVPKDWLLEQIESCTLVGSFTDEYVYDLEVDEVDGSTFIANDILVHNSCYISFEEVVKSCNFPGNPKDLILLINKHRLADYLNKMFDKYAAKWNTKNQMDFELENISESGIWLAKKKYLVDLVWESGIDIDSMTQIVFKGVELAQSSTPPFAREKLKEIIKYILVKKKGLKMPELTKMLRDMKTEFKLAEPEKISSSRKINDYGKFVLNDTTGFEVGKATPIHIRAAGYHNFMLNNNSYKSKYQMIRQGDKVKFYYSKAKRGEEDVFAFIPGMFPYEFAPDIDYDTMFAKTIIDPVNRVVVAMKLPPIPPGLQIAHALF